MHADVRWRLLAAPHEYANYRFPGCVTPVDRSQTGGYLFIRSRGHHEATTSRHERQNPSQPTSLNHLRKKALQISAPAPLRASHSYYDQRSGGPPGVPAATLQLTRSSTYKKRQAQL